MIDDLHAFVVNIFVLLTTRVPSVQDKKLQLCLVWFEKVQELHLTTLDQIGWFDNKEGQLLLQDYCALAF